jgi:hypothetical protein
MSTLADPTNLLIATRALTALLEEENALLAAGQVRGIEALQVEKQRLTQSYARESARLRQVPDWKRRLAPGQFDELRDASHAFDDAMNGNRRRLTAMRSISEGLVGAIGQAAARRSAPVQGYDRSGQMRPMAVRQPAALAGRAVPIALNQRI